jgi:hypothetical protein
MKKLLALSVALALGGCASMPAMQKVVHRPQAHVVAPAALPAPVAKPTITVVPATPVPPATFKMRWSQRVGKLRNIPLFHHKKEN